MATPGETSRPHEPEIEEVFSETENVDMDTESAGQIPQAPQPQPRQFHQETPPSFKPTGGPWFTFDDIPVHKRLER